MKALSITPFVIHDKDTEGGAIKFNNPIVAALDHNENKRYMVVNTIEDVLGYSEPPSEKPYTAYKHITANWGDSWVDIPENWRAVFEKRMAKDLFDK